MTESPQEIWQADINGDLFETNLQEITQWISEGALLPQDKVRRGNLRWIEAKKVPLLIPFFNAIDQGVAPPTLVNTTVNTQPIAQSNPFQTQNFAPVPAETPTYLPQNQNFNAPPQNFQVPPTTIAQPVASFEPAPTQISPAFEELPQQDYCILHEGEPPKFFCETCFNVFCHACPKGYGGNVRICPMCGSMCKSIGTHQAEREKALKYQQDMQKGFGFGDFGDAIVYPLKYKVSLFFGAILYMFFSIGQLAAGSGSFMMFAAVLICFMLANMLSFSILANTVENFSQGKITRNFMPDFDEFSLWDDVVQPFFLNIAVFLVSFGLAIVVIIGSIFIMWGSVTESVKKESDKRMEAVNKQKEIAKKLSPTGGWESDKDRAYREDLERMNKQSQINNLKSMGIADPESDLTFEETMGISLRAAGFFIIPVILALLWGIFYYPIACTVAGYSRSFSATINPSVGWEAIKLLGADYVKILGMYIILMITLVIIELVLGFVLSAFNLPGVGNIPATAILSLFKFYISIVFAVVLGYALYKNASKFNFRLD